MTNDLLPAAAPDFDDPLGMLRACHRRIERQLATLGRLERHLPGHVADDDARSAARAIMRYFDTAAVHHHADEEDTLFPRLLAQCRSEIEPVVTSLERDHAVLEAHWRRIREPLVAIAAGEAGTLPKGEVERITAAYNAHIEREERELLPVAERVLDSAALRACGEEMARRRGLAGDDKPV